MIKYKMNEVVLITHATSNYVSNSAIISVLANLVDIGNLLYKFDCVVT